MHNIIGNMDAGLRIAMIIGAIAYLLVIFIMLKKKKLTVKFSIIWLLSGFALLVFALFPYIVYVLRDILHVEVPSNLVFMMLFAFVLLLLLSLSSAVSDFAEKIKRLTQTNALLEERLRTLESRDKK